MVRPTGWYLALAPTDLRYGVDRLLVLVRDALGQDVRAGGAFVFCNRARTRIKVLHVDAQGVWLATRRLHEGRFQWPRPEDTVCRITPEAFAWLAAGVNWQRLVRRVEDLPTAV